MEIKRYEFLYQYEKEHWWYYGRRQLLINLIKSLNINKHKKLLDIGCGCGYNLITLNEITNGFGVDIEPQSIAYCKKRGLKNVQLITNNKFPYKKNTFDVITCLDVIEHIKNDQTYLFKIKSLLKNNGYLILFVPTYPILWGELDLKSHHYRRYKRKKLLNTIRAAGFRVEKENYFNSIFFIPILLVRLYQKLPIGKKNEWGYDPKIKSVKINNILKSIFRLDIFLSIIVKQPFGVSLYVVAKKL